MILVEIISGGSVAEMGIAEADRAASVLFRDGITTCGRKEKYEFYMHGVISEKYKNGTNRVCDTHPFNRAKENYFKENHF